MSKLKQLLFSLNETDRKVIEEKLKTQDQQIDQLKQQLAKKDKEIEKLNKTLEMCKHIERYDIGEMFLENAKLIIEKRQFAIQELEKVKEEMDLNGNSYCEIRQGTSPHNPTDYAWFNYVKFRNYLNQQIKELKGEK